jgi:tRNA threonylcarbamoyl adenosine modification protein YeaZ
VLVLAIDTSSDAVTAGVARVDGGVEIVAEQVTVNPRGHGELLAPSIAAALDHANASPSDLAAIVAGVGPGPYTGLRVGLVTAAVMAEALGIPTYGVCSLDAIAEACRDEPQLVVATDARRREVYWARYEHGARAGEPAVDAPAEVPIDGVTAVAGHAATLYDFGVPGRDVLYPPVLSLVRCALERITAGAPAELLTPLYLRRPDAVVPAAPKSVSQ